MSRCLILLILPALVHGNTSQQYISTTHVSGHASLVEPPSRAAMHLYGFPQNPVSNILIWEWDLHQDLHQQDHMSSLPWSVCNWTWRISRVSRVSAGQSSTQARMLYPGYFNFVWKFCKMYILKKSIESIQVDYQHNEGFCGGFSHQFSPAIGGRLVSQASKLKIVWLVVLHRRCGICGDAWDANPREHEVTSGCTEMSIAMIVCLCGVDCALHFV